MRSSIKMAFLGSVTVLAVVLLGLLTVVSVYTRSSQMEEDVAERLEAQGVGIAERFSRELTHVAGKTDALATSLSAMNGTYDMNHAFALTQALVASDDMIYGSGIWFAPGEYPGGEKWFGPYFSKDDKGQISMTMEYSTEAYDYTQFGWYKAAIQGPKEVFWDEPAYDDVSKTTMMSSSAPIRAGGRVVGVVTVDIGMKDLEDYIQNIKVGEHGYAFLVTQSGLYAASPDADANMNQKITDSTNKDQAALGSKIMELTGRQHRARERRRPRRHERAPRHRRRDRDRGRCHRLVRHRAAERPERHRLRQQLPRGNGAGAPGAHRAFQDLKRERRIC